MYVLIASLERTNNKGADQPHVRIQRGDRGSGPPPLLKNHKNIGFLSNSGPDPLDEATEPEFNVGPLIVVFGSTHLSLTKKTKKKKRCQSWTPSDKIF